LFYFANLFVEILGRKGSGTMIEKSEVVLWGVGFILFWQGFYPPGGTTRGFFGV